MVRVLVQSLKIVSVFALAVLVAGGSIRLFQYAIERATPADVGEQVTFVVEEDETTEEVAERLEEEGLIRNKMLFMGQMRLAQGSLEAGDYALRKGMTNQQIIDRITGVQVAEAEPAVAAAAAAAAAETFQITIPEGWRIEQIAEEYARLGGEGGFDAFMRAVAEVDRSRYDFLADLPPDLPLEGYLFPDTYTFRADNPAANVQMMLTNFGTKYTEEMRSRTRQMNLTIHEVVTLASLVEREAQIPDERPTIADVYISRWEEGWNLEADPTAQYVLGTPEEWWPKLGGSDLERAVSPYNTYLNEGLPPGPICNPGFASLQAVLFPADTDFMFFVAKQDGSGEHVFAVTAEEQAANVETYLRGGGAAPAP